MEEVVEESKEQVSEYISGEEDKTKLDDNMISWEELVGSKEEQTLIAKCGGVFKQDDKNIMPFVGTNPADNVNVWLYDQDKEKYLIDSRKLERNWECKMGPVWPDQFSPNDLKMQKKTQEACTIYTATKFDGLTVAPKNNR
eukprot:4998500-Ditylum_brightwellii.AAC.2